MAGSSTRKSLHCVMLTSCQSAPAYCINISRRTVMTRRRWHLPVCHVQPPLRHHRGADVYAVRAQSQGGGARQENIVSVEPDDVGAGEGGRIAANPAGVPHGPSCAAINASKRRGAPSLADSKTRTYPPRHKDAVSLCFGLCCHMSAHAQPTGAYCTRAT